MHKMPKIDRTGISGRLQDETGWICENDHRVRLTKKEACLAQGRSGRFHQRRIDSVLLKKFSLEYKRSALAFDRYPMILRTLPRRCHHRSHRRRRGAIFNEPFPRPADFLFFNHIEGPVLVFRHRGEGFEHSEDRLSNSLPDKIFGYVQESIWSAHPYLTLSG